MDCRTAQMLASFVSPTNTELDADQVAALESHLRMCPHCGKSITGERRFDRKVVKAMKSVVLPSGLKNQILDRIKPQIPWYGRTAWQVTLATAATILIGVWIIIAGSSRTAITYENLSSVQQNPLKDRAKNWLNAMRIDFNPQLPIDLNLLATYGVKDLIEGGPQTPFLYLDLRDGRGWAEIYIVNRNEYRWDQLSDELSFGGLQFAIFPDTKTDRQAYLVFYTTQELKPFLTPFKPF